MNTRFCFRILAGLLVTVVVTGSGLAAETGVSDGGAIRMIYDERLPQPSPPVKGFTAYGGDWRVKDGELETQGGAGPKLISDEPPFATGEIGFEVLLSSSRAGNGGLVVKVREPGVVADQFIGRREVGAVSLHLFG